MYRTNHKNLISAIAITYNEETHVNAFIKSLAFADEVIIIDSYSTDKTVEIAKQLGAKVITRPFDNFSNQKTFALQQASYDWIVFFDLDEIISPELVAEIELNLTQYSHFSAFKVKRNFYFMNKHMKYSGFQNDTVVRVFKKENCKYNTSTVHEALDVNGPIKLLKHTVNHYTYKDFDSYNEKLTKYSKLQAEMLFNANKKPNIYHFTIRPFWRFFHQYFIKLGILDGKEGFILAYLNAFAVFNRYLFLWLKFRDLD